MLNSNKRLQGSAKIVPGLQKLSFQENSRGKVEVKVDSSILVMLLDKSKILAGFTVEVLQG